MELTIKSFPGNLKFKKRDNANSFGILSVMNPPLNNTEVLRKLYFTFLQTFSGQEAADFPRPLPYPREHVGEGLVSW